jgi:hypothetical protein
MIWRPARRRACVDAVLAAYGQWRSERDAVRAAETGLAHQLAGMGAW